MKTKELIQRLQDADPSGELEVVADDNSDIHFVERQPGYHDGCGQALIRDETKFGYNILGVRIFSGGWKIRLHVASIQEVLDHNPDAVIDLSLLYGEVLLDYQNCIKAWRDTARSECSQSDEK